LFVGVYLFVELVDCGGCFVVLGWVGDFVVLECVVECYDVFVV